MATRVSRGKFEGHRSIGRPQNPQFGANSMHVSLKVAELQLLEVAIGLMQFFRFFCEK